MASVNGSAKQETVGIGYSPAADRTWKALGTTRSPRSARSATVSTIEPGSHLWFAVAVSLVLHGLLLTVLAVKSHWIPVYHPAMYSMGSGFSVIQFVSGTSDGPVQGGGPKDADTAVSDVELPSLPSRQVEVSESPLLMEEQPAEEVAFRLSTGQEAQLVHEPVTGILQPEPTANRVVTGEPSGVGSVADGTGAGGIDGQDINRAGTGAGTTESSGDGSSYGIPAYLRNPLPPYPRVAREHGWEGTTLLQVQVLDDGSGGNVQILESSGHEVLDEAAVKTVRHWRFLPARSGDTAIRSLVEIPIRFRMAGN